MFDAEKTDLVELTAEVVAAYVAKNHVQASEMPALISTVYGTLAGLGSVPEAASDPVKLVPLVSIKKSVTDEFIISLEDGKRYRTLKKHLSKLGITPNGYRDKWGLPSDYPMVAPAYARQRSELAKRIGLGAKPRTV